MAQKKVYITVSKATDLPNPTWYCKFNKPHAISSANRPDYHHEKKKRKGCFIISQFNTPLCSFIRFKEKSSMLYICDNDIASRLFRFGCGTEYQACFLNPRIGEVEINMFIEVEVAGDGANQKVEFALTRKILFLKRVLGTCQTSVKSLLEERDKIVQLKTSDHFAVGKLHLQVTVKNGEPVDTNSSSLGHIKLGLSLDESHDGRGPNHPTPGNMLQMAGFKSDLLLTQAYEANESANAILGSGVEVYQSTE